MKNYINMNARVKELMNKMTAEEMRQRLAEYMEADVNLMPRLVAVQVRLSSEPRARHRYEVVLIDEDGGESIVKFHDRCSRLMYIYALLHPKGFQRRAAASHDYRELRLRGTVTQGCARVLTAGLALRHRLSSVPQWQAAHPLRSPGRHCHPRCITQQILSLTP